MSDAEAAATRQPAGSALEKREPQEPGEAGAAGEAWLARSPSAMAPRVGWLATRFGRRFFGGFALEPDWVEQLRTLERRGAVVYVMRYSSRLDYLLFNWLFLRQGLRLAVFANAIRSYAFRPFWEGLPAAARALAGRLRRGRDGVRRAELELLRAALRERQSVFLFLRTHRLPALGEARRDAVVDAQREIDWLREVVSETFAGGGPVALVPLAMFWRKTANHQARRFNDVFYGSPERPTPTWKLLSFLFGYRNLAVRVGREFDLRGFVETQRESPVERVARQVRRALLIFLRREEKPVLGAVLRPRARTVAAVLADPEVGAVIDAIAAAEGVSRARVETRARRYVGEIAAHPNPTIFALLDLLVNWVSHRLFARVQVIGLERVVEAAKLHPVVLMPSHRSHFDYLLLSWLFYENHLAPPLVAAGANLAFWPVGPIYRRAGAFFLRRSFGGDRLYTSVFRSYTQMLIKDGITQEFFIEGTRSRTGKTLQPRLGMLGMILDAFRRGVRRDVYLVPIGFTYERLVEESAMTQEKRGARKVQENLFGLLRARGVLQSRFGEVIVRFGVPISLAEVAGSVPSPAGSGAAASAAGAAGTAEQSGAGPASRRGELRGLAARLGDDICRSINQLITAGGSAVTAAALLGQPGRALRVVELRAAVQELVLLLRRSGMPCSDSLEAALAAGQPEQAAAQLLQSGLLERRSSRGGDLLTFPESAREALAYYRASVAPGLALAAVLALALGIECRGEAPEKEVLDRAANWLRLLRLEYFPPPFPERQERLERTADHFVARGWARRAEGQLRLLPEGQPWTALLAAQIRPLLENYRALLTAVRSASLPQTQEQLFAEAKAVLEEHLLLAEARSPEAVCSTTAGNALRYLIEDEILLADGDPRRVGTRLERGARWGALDEWLSRLARALG